MTNADFVSYLAAFNSKIDCDLFYDLLGELEKGRARPQLLREWGRGLELSQLSEEFERNSQNGIVRVHPEHSYFPENWRRMLCAPAGFFLLGNPVWLEQSGIAIVGSREPCAENRKWMDLHLPQFLACSKKFVLSGAARGVDQLAHAAALKLELPTVSILPSGLGSPYPESFSSWIETILSMKGAILSEYPFYQPMRKHHFLRRNRLIATLTHHTLVIEARRRSGTYITARETLENGRNLGVVPCHPMYAKGCGGLDLIRDGAMVILEAEDLKTWVGF